MRRISWQLLVISAALAAPACDRGSEPQPASAPSASAASTALIEAADEQAPEVTPQQQHGVARKAGERVTIPAGKLVAGSTPGDRGRDPTLEPMLLELELPAFDIDKLPYPNDPRQPPVTNLSRAAAAKKCAAAGGRLCTELEWERACKGPDGQPYAGAAAWDESCASRPETCASGFGVLAMGAAMREWTASDVAPIPRVRSKSAAAVRGAGAKAADVEHRCAHRMAVDPGSTSGDLGFRCCYGPAPDASIASPEWLPSTAEKTDFSPERLAQLFASNPKLQPFSKDVKYFAEESAIATVTRNASDEQKPKASETLTTAPLLWNPVPGEEIVLATGQSAGAHSFVVAFHRLSDDRYRLASVLVLENQPGPVVLAYDQNVRRKLSWAACWECFGEAGNITYRNDHRVVISVR